VVIDLAGTLVARIIRLNQFSAELAAKLLYGISLQHFPS
jgi:hypothetical protein